MDAQHTPPSDTGQANGINPRAVLWISDSEGVSLGNNALVRVGPYAGRPIVLPPSVHDVSPALSPP